MARTNRKRENRDIDNRLARKKRLDEKKTKKNKNFKIESIDYTDMAEDDWEELESQYE